MDRPVQFPMEIRRNHLKIKIKKVNHEKRNKVIVNDSTEDGEYEDVISDVEVFIKYIVPDYTLLKNIKKLIFRNILMICRNVIIIQI
jgi:hypothetical protein